jgi:PKD repeat protein
MKHLLRIVLVSLLCTSFNHALFSQEDIPPLELCVDYGTTSIGNALEGTGLEGSLAFPLDFQSPCLRFDDIGNIFLSPSATEERCCGPIGPIFFRIETSNGAQLIREVTVILKCGEKPDCGLVDLDELQSDPSDNPDIPGRVDCIPACENSKGTYLYTETDGLDYNWIATNGTVMYDPGVPGQLMVTWGPLGPSALTLEIINPATGEIVETRAYCVNLTEAPVASFTATTEACLDQPVSFTNTSTGAPATYDWDFGDGTFVTNVTDPTHIYTAPGTYTVTLYATSEGGLNPDGSQACCCVDSVQQNIVIDPLPGPGIFWISTLCEGDVSKYWTDATGCDNYNWSVSSNGTIMGPATGDTIMVQWGSGPSGTITLDVDNCDQAYCDSPTEVIVPIISSVGVIDGPTEVCKGQSATYALPKWMTVTYDWSVSDGTINSDNGGNVVNITWPSVPGTYVIEVSYGSDFLNGLPNHDGDDCYGTARLEVTVLGDFNIIGPNQACVNQTSFFFGSSDFGGATFDWSLDGFPAFDQSNSSSYSVDWSLLPGPGVYTVTASANSPGPGDYCAPVQSQLVIVSEAIDPTIDGPADYCVGEPVVYNVPSPAAGYSYFWTATGGTVTAGNGGPTVTVVWSATSGATLSVVGQDGNPPFCLSNPATINPVTKDFVGSPVITGPDGCTNSVETYGISVDQHDDATYSWSISPDSLGSVIANGDTDTPTVQWNADAGNPIITVTISLCGQDLVLSRAITLTAPVEPIITQIGDLCPGGSVDLQVQPGLSVTWSPGGSTANPLTVTTPGNYVANTVDANGCPAVATYEVEEVDGPAVTLSAVGPLEICVNQVPLPVGTTLTASTNPANTIEWFCGGDSQGPAAVGNTSFTHLFNDTPGVFVYVAVVTDPNGCTTTSDPIIIRHTICCGEPYKFIFPDQHTAFGTPRSPDCDIWDLDATFPPDSVDADGWDLSALPDDSQVLGTFGTNGLSVRPSEAGCWEVSHAISVWSEPNTTVFTDQNGQDSIVIDSILCSRELPVKICVPFLADFDKDEDCGTVFFTDLTDIDPLQVSGPLTYSWDFGDGSPTSSATDPMHQYGANGTYTVTLTVSEGGCESTATMTFNVTDLPDSDFTTNPTNVCVDEPATFNGTGTDVIQWEWDFGDDANFVGNGPQHTYSSAGTYLVTLITTNSAGCMDTITKNVVAHPAPTPDTIAYDDLIICEGSNANLSIVPQAGASYLWTTGDTGTSISVTMAGVYGVTITTADGCELVLDPVEVQVVPLPDPSWVGNPFICDNGSTTLTALAGGGHTYLWTNTTTGEIVTTRDYVVNFSSGNTIQTIELVVTNLFDCEAQSVITVEQVTSPNPILAITGGDCEGDGSTITVTNPEPDVEYTWSTGATGLSIFTYQAGTYTVVATNTITGCTGTDQAVINPLPDLCIVPVGCYETCKPDTLCAPVGDYTYQWLFNDVAIPASDGGQDRCLIVSDEGKYNVVVTDINTSCVNTSGDLFLEIIDCDDPCENLVTRIAPFDKPNEAGECCFDIFYAGAPAEVTAIEIMAMGADLNIVPGTINPAFDLLFRPDDATIQLTQIGGGSIPTNATTQSLLALCPVDATVDPQTIIVKYLNDDLEVVCADTLITECPVEPDCIYVTQDTLICGPEQVLTLNLTVCNPLDAAFDVSYLQLLPLTPAAGVDLPIGLPVSPALLPGECRDFTITLSDLPPGEDFCYDIVGHSADPNEDPTALCCSLGEEQCLEVPDCDPCDDLGVRRVRERDDCCYDIFLFNQVDILPMTGVDLCLLGSDGDLAVYTSLGDPWVASVGSGGGMVSIRPVDGGELPQNTFGLPRICIDDNENAFHQIEIKWLSGDSIVCRDTIEVFCEPPCGYLTEESIDCENEVYVWTGTFTNTSDFVMDHGYITFDPSLGLSAWNTTIPFSGPLAPGDSESITIIIGAPAGPLDSICFTLSLYTLSDEGLPVNCCNIEACIQLPDCPITKCECDEKFFTDIQQGFTGSPDPGSFLDYTFNPVAEFTGCDSLTWIVRLLPRGTREIVGTDYIQEYSFPSPGRYQVCMRVTRTLDNGETCEEQICRTVRITQGIATDLVRVYPTPATSFLTIEKPVITDNRTSKTLELLDLNGRPIRMYPNNLQQEEGEDVFTISLEGIKPGVYLLRGNTDEGPWVKRIIVQ